MLQPRGRESRDFWAGVTCASSLEGEMPPKWAADTEPHTRGWGTRGLPFIWKNPAPTCQGFAAHRDTILLQKQHFFFRNVPFYFIFSTFYFILEYSQSAML